MATLSTVNQLVFLFIDYSLLKLGILLTDCLELLSVDVEGDYLVWGKVLLALLAGLSVEHTTTILFKGAKV